MLAWFQENWQIASATLPSPNYTIMLNDKLYSVLPERLQNEVVSVYGMMLKRKRYGPIFSQALNGMIERSEWTQQKILDYREEKLAEACRRASQTNFYSRILDERGWDWKKLLDPECFSQLPILDKKTIRNNYNDLRPRPSANTDQILTTSGTTGESLSFSICNQFEPIQWAVWWRYRNWHGITQGMTCALFASAPIVKGEIRKKPWRFDRHNNEYRFSIFHISPGNASLYVDELNSIQPDWVHGNPTALALLASHISNQNLELKLNLKAVTVGSENLLGWQRFIIEKTFKTNVVQHYGLAEGVANISECENGNLHIDEDFSYVELLEHKGLQSGSRIIGSQFDNLAFSILRYDTGDLATLADESCSCGHPGRIVSSLDGRTTDYVVLPSGKRIASLAAPFHDCDWLGGAQIVQKKSGELKIRLVPLKEWSNSNLAALERSLRVRLGKEIDIEFQIVSEIPKTIRGKHKLVLSEFGSGD